MEIRKEVNYKIDWHAVSNTTSYPTSEESQKVLDDRIHYFNMLRRLLQDLQNLGLDNVDEVLAKYKVHFVDIDDIPRVNLDEPE